MATTPMATLLSLPSLSSPNHKSSYSFNTLNLSFSIVNNKATHFQYSPRIFIQKPCVWRISAVSAESLASEVNTVDNTELVSTVDDGGVSNVISVLLFIAFVGLSILTIGVIYIAVIDFLQKREKDRFEKEEAINKKKKSGKKVRTRARAGPRGFGQKVEENDED